MKYGAYLAIVSILISITQWATHMVEKLGLMTNFIIGMITIIISIFLLIYCIKNFRDSFLNEKITFSQAFTIGILSIIFSSIIIALYNYSLHSWIDPEYSARVVEAMQEKTSNLLYSMGAPEDQIEEALSKFDGMEVPTPIEKVISGIQGNIIGGAILSLIAAAIVKKSKKKSGFEEAMSEIED